MRGCAVRRNPFNEGVDTRTRWLVGILLALVIGLGVGLIIVAGDNGSNNSPSTVPLQSISVAAPTTTSRTTSTATSTTPNGGTPVPGSTTTGPGGTGGL
jgi:hypothetical protein